MPRWRIGALALALGVVLLPGAASRGSGVGVGAEASLPDDVAPASVLGLDAHGTPLVCGVDGESPLRSQEAAAAGALPDGTRGWETVPGVVRTDGVETFRLEVEVQEPVSRVTLQSVSPFLIAPVPPPLELRDDGTGEDRVAGDLVFTAGPFRYDPNAELPAFYDGDATSPVGLDVVEVGDLDIEALDGTPWRFLDGPAVGILRADVPATAWAELSPDLVVAPHLINVRTDLRASQDWLRTRSLAARSLLADLGARVYQLVPDAFDFLVLLSSHRIEQFPGPGRNFVAGTQLSVKLDVTGTGRTPFDDTAEFGSAGRLQGITTLDAYRRGLNGGTITHELMHQWGAYLDPSLGLSEGVHYDPRSNVGSLLGGFQWLANGDGTFTINCEEGNSGAHRASRLDRYLMGLGEAGDVPVLRAYSDASPGPIAKCFQSEPVSAQEIVTEVSIEDIQALHGARTPAPPAAQRDFAVGFVVESYQRLLDPTELTFYEILASHHAKPVPAHKPDPYVSSSGWAPVARFFGGGATWTSLLPGLGEACLGPGDCPETEFCRTANGSCGATGMCTPLPAFCSGTFDPVCGCDGSVHGNACRAAQAGVSVGLEGDCGERLVVDSLDDAPDAIPGDGRCRSAGGSCTLRAAVMEANELPGRQSIELPPGRHSLALPADADPLGADPTTGDLDVFGDLLLIGTGSRELPTVIDGGGMDRVFDIGIEDTPPRAVEILRVGIENGSAPGAAGGGIRNRSGFVTLRETTVAGNSAGAGGGLANLDNLTSPPNEIVLISSTVTENQALGGNDSIARGGGIHVPAGDLVVVNSTISGNFAELEGGGLFVAGNSRATLRNATVAANQAGLGGGGMRLGGPSALVANSIVALNDPDDCGLPPATVLSEGFNLDGDGSCALSGPGDLPGTDPLLAPLGDNGGPTWTHALGPGSPAVDAADAAGCRDASDDLLPRDQRGDVRTLDGDGDGAARCDVGAFELARSCQAADECGADELCRTAPGACGGPGSCWPRPTSCFPLSDPVCGCDGRTYPSGCEAAEAGTSVDFESECAICGDGVVDPGEGCDDGDLGGGDGCSSACAVEAGYVCTGRPSTCVPVCGDGLLRIGEGCDDGNLASGDGCSATCAVESGYGCAGEPSACNPLCGDGLVRASEGCDDGNLGSGDGCSAACVVESGYGCAGEPSVCEPVCGDGLVRGAESCDDGNLGSGDGCSAGCTVEPGYLCTGRPSACAPLCGDGLVIVGGEACDPPGERGICPEHTACAPDCASCDPVPYCGDGNLDPGEQCDPPDGGLTCDADCMRVPEPAALWLGLSALVSVLWLSGGRSARGFPEAR